MHRIIALCLTLLSVAACDGTTAAVEEPVRPVYRIAVLVDNVDALPELEWAVERVQAAGGVAGGDLVLEYVDLTEARTTQTGFARLIAQTAARQDIQAAIGLNTSADLLQATPLFEAARKPIISFSATGSEVTRAFLGSTHIWRTKLADMAQVSFLVGDAQQQQIRKIGLVTPADGVGETFFNWFAFFATDAQYPEDAVTIEVYGDGRTCADAMAAAVQGGVQYLIAVPEAAEDLRCIAEGVASLRGPGGRLGVPVLIADTGLELPPLLQALGPIGEGLQGWSSGPKDADAFSAQWLERFETDRIPSNAAAAYDAILLIAYGLEASAGQPGALAEGIVTATSGRGTAVGWHAAGIAAALVALRAGQLPDISGIASDLTYEEGVDPADGTLQHWVQGPTGRNVDQTVQLPTEEMGVVARARPPAAGNFVPPTGNGSFGTPMAAQHLSALVLSSSSGWSNYRHQADALNVYQRLRAGGVADDDIMMIGADDIAENPLNALPGEVRNRVGGDDVRAGVQYDYGLTLDADAVMGLLVDESAEQDVQLNPNTNLLIYLVGHGGQQGLALGAETAAEGANASSGTLTPTHLRETLCALRATGDVRRIFVVIESCYSGVFGDAAFGGIEAGCDGVPLEGVLLITAANTNESSFGAEYDSTLGAWVGDQFSVAFDGLLKLSPNIASLYQDLYLQVPGSHVTLYNGDNYGGSLTVLQPDEFFDLPTE